jgi:hypothetical protein
LRRKLVQRVSIRLVLYSSLGLLFGVSILVEALGSVLRWSWTGNWMPNFIAEWSGIFVAVFVVERLLALQQHRAAEVQLKPLRVVAGDMLASSIAPIVACAWILRRTALVDPGLALVRRYGEFNRPLEIEEVAEFDHWDGALRESTSALDRFRRDYWSLLEPSELVTLDQARKLIEELSSPKRATGTDLDSALSQLYRPTRDISPIFQRLTGKELTLLTPEIRTALLEIRASIRLLDVEARLRKP